MGETTRCDLEEIVLAVCNLRGPAQCGFRLYTAEGETLCNGSEDCPQKESVAFQRVPPVSVSAITAPVVEAEKPAPVANPEYTTPDKIEEIIEWVNNNIILDAGKMAVDARNMGTKLRKTFPGVEPSDIPSCPHCGKLYQYNVHWHHLDKAVLCPSCNLEFSVKFVTAKVEEK